MSGTIVVLGATGYTGRLAVEALLRRGVRPVLAGRRADELARLADHLGGLQWATADVTDPESVRTLLGPGDTLLTTVGPFERFGYLVAEAAASVGAHYVDSTGEVGFVREIHRRYDDVARRHGATMLPAFGYDYVPGTLAGALALAEAPTAQRLEIGYFATGSLRNGLSHGTRTTMADGLTLPTTVWRDKHLTDVRTASAVSTFRVRGRRRTGFLVSGTEVLFLPAAHPSLTSVEVYNGWFPALSRAITVTSALANQLTRRPAGARLVDRISTLATGPAGGPDEAERARTLTHAVARATDSADNTLTEVHLEGPSIYSLTGELLALAAQLLDTGAAHLPGVVGPIEAFDLSVIENECAQVGLRRTTT
ncbi:saccharopine dehydrogenase NADP-binding domain-containing protein [Pseudonocardia sp. NPDC046786]|uniref:saccharopine dehydrogenase family protein n=1 Tax=Pseudonocardia sp. NPDC046786 TaxID=3155471 RepID=UPI0033E401FF